MVRMVRTGSLTEKPMVTKERGAVIITGLKSNCQIEISGDRSSSLFLLASPGISAKHRGRQGCWRASVRQGVAAGTSLACEWLVRRARTIGQAARRARRGASHHG